MAVSTQRAHARAKAMSVSTAPLTGPQRRCRFHVRDFRCRWEVAEPGRTTSRRAERSSRRGRRAGGPPPTGTPSSPAHGTTRAAPGTPAEPQATSSIANSGCGIRGRQQGQVAAGPGCGARGRWRGMAGLRADAPSAARGADGSRAGRRPRAHKAARPTGQHVRRPEHQRRHKHRRTEKPQNSS